MARNLYDKLLRQTVHCIILCGLLDGSAVVGQTNGTHTPAGHTIDKAELNKALAAVKSGEASNYHAEIIAEAHAVEAIPDLEAQFARASEPLEKAKFAQVLLVLGDKKDLYWDYLAGLLQPALETDEPDPILYDAQGKIVPGLSAAWIGWSKAHNAPGGTAQDPIYMRLVVVKLIAETGDPRAIPLLRRAVSSPNELLVGTAAKGLARFQDKASIPSIIAACKKSPAEGASFIAESLVFFDDPDAQSTFDKYVPKDRANTLRAEKAKQSTSP